MRQVTQNYRTGELCLEDVPVPICRAGEVLVRSRYSLVSTGTELMKVAQARMSMLEKARSRPDKVQQVIQSIKQKGVVETYKLVQERLNCLTPIGYSSAGVVEERGSGIDEFAVGDRVACAGEGIACHAEFISVPRNLCVRIPEGVDIKDAAYTTVGSIAMQGVRQAGVTLGDTVVVVGLGLIGLLGVQILKAAGCRVIGVDLDRRRVQLAEACGADVAICRNELSVEDAVRQLTGGAGADVAYIAASTKSNDPMELAGKIVRDRGKVVIVGMVSVEADWRTYYVKELSVVLSRSYGPGRYDRNYEQKGIDYPIGYVRWTERRNMEEFLRLVQSGQIAPSRVGQKVFAFDRAPEAYDELHESPGENPVGILFEYPPQVPVERRIAVSSTITRGLGNGQCVNIGMVGAGNFATGTLIPALRQTGKVRLRGICSARGLSAKSSAKRHGFEYCASDYRELLADKDIHAVVIATHHDTHARLTAEALRGGKHVFVEKPLALTREQLDEVIAAQAETGNIVMVGFNRRFSPLSVAIRDFFGGRESPVEILYRVNAGSIKADSWYQDPEEGGWRIVSEGCHFVDLIQYLCGCRVVSVYAEMIGGQIPTAQNDNCAVTLKMADGSLGIIVYVANGDPCYEKERVEIFGRGCSAVIENWNVAKLVAQGKTRRAYAKGTGKGHGQELAAFVELVANGGETDTFDEAVATTLSTLAVADSLRAQAPIVVANRSE